MILAHKYTEPGLNINFELHIFIKMLSNLKKNQILILETGKFDLV